MISLNNIQIRKIDTYIGFSVKSGKIIYGLDMLKKSKIKPFIILMDENVGQSTFKQTNLYAERNDVKCLILPKNHLNELLKRSNIKVLSIFDENLSKAIISIIQ